MRFLLPLPTPYTIPCYHGQRILCQILYCIMQDFGHPGADLFNKIAPILQVPELRPEKHTLCPTCSLAKAISRKGKTSRTVYSQPLQLLQVDLCGNFRYKNFTGSHYFLTIRDAYSRYYTVIHLKNKSDAPDKFIEWVKITENHFASRGGYKVGAVRTDNGSSSSMIPFMSFSRGRVLSTS